MFVGDLGRLAQVGANVDRFSEGPAIEKFNRDRKFQSWLELFNLDRENFDLDRNFQSRCFYLQGPPGVQRRADQ